MFTAMECNFPHLPQFIRSTIYCGIDSEDLDDNGKPSKGYFTASDDDLNEGMYPPLDNIQKAGYIYNFPTELAFTQKETYKPFYDVLMNPNFIHHDRLLRLHDEYERMSGAITEADNDLFD